MGESDPALRRPRRISRRLIDNPYNNQLPETPMFTRIDHVMICVPDLAQGMEQYQQARLQHPCRAACTPARARTTPSRSTRTTTSSCSRSATRPSTARHERSPERYAAARRIHRGGRRHPLRHPAERRPGGGRERDARARRRRERRARRRRRTPAGQELAVESRDARARQSAAALLHPAPDADGGAPQAGAGRGQASERRLQARARLHRHARRRGRRGALREGARHAPADARTRAR